MVEVVERDPSTTPPPVPHRRMTDLAALADPRPGAPATSLPLAWRTSTPSSSPAEARSLASRPAGRAHARAARHQRRALQRRRARAGSARRLPAGVRLRRRLRLRQAGPVPRRPAASRTPGSTSCRCAAGSISTAAASSRTLVRDERLRADPRPHAAVAAWSACQAARLAGVPLVYHVHSPAGRDSTRRLRNQINVWLERRAGHRAARLIAVSPSVRRYMIEQGFSRQPGRLRAQRRAADRRRRRDRRRHDVDARHGRAVPAPQGH